MLKRKKYPSKEYLDECFIYNNGVLYWKERPLYHFKNIRTYKAFIKNFVGKEAGSIDNGRYVIGVNNTVYLRSILIWILHGNDPPTQQQQIDHKNRNKLDDSIENLRIGTSQQNKFNKTTYKSNTIGFRGIRFDKKCKNKPWHVRININGKKKSLGYYSSLEEAREVFINTSKEIYGEFAYYNNLD